MKLKSTFLALATAVLGTGSLCAGASALTFNLEVDRPVILADTREKVVLKVGVGGCVLPHAERAPVNLCIVLDRSGSMSGVKLERAKDAAIEAVRRLGRGDIFSLVVYNNGVETLIPATSVDDLGALENRIRRLTCGGGTNIFGGVTQGAAEVRKNLESPRAYTHRVILLSDGLANIGPSTPEDLGRLGSALVKEGISVSTIGLGDDYNEDLMTRLARRSDGNTYYVSSTHDLPGVFQQELGDVLAVAARRVEIDIEFPEGVRPICFVGREGTIKGRRATLQLNQVYGSQEKFALIEVEVDPGKADAIREIAHAHVRYEHALENRPFAETAKVTLRHSPRQQDVVSAVNMKVQSQYVENRIALAKDEAIALADANQPALAAERLRKESTYALGLASTYSNYQLNEVAAAPAAQAKKIESEGLDNRARKEMRTSSEQMRSNQSASSSSK